MYQITSLSTFHFSKCFKFSAFGINKTSVKSKTKLNMNKNELVQKRQIEKSEILIKGISFHLFENGTKLKIPSEIT